MCAEEVLYQPLSVIMKKQTQGFTFTSDVQDAIRKGARKILVRTVDTDVIVILVGVYFHIHNTYHDAGIWVGFGTGKNYKCYNI